MGETFKINKDRKEVVVKIGRNLSCTWWGNNWGEISHYLESLSQKKAVSKVRVIFSYCAWADPIPLLSIILDLQHIKNDLRLPVEIILPRLNSSNVNNQNFPKGQFLKFLATQGFLDELVRNFVVKDDKYFISQNTITKYRNYQYRLVYDNAEVFRARTFTIENDNSKREIIKIVENEMYGTLKNTVSLQTFNMLLEQIYNILNELIENVRQHAYRDGEKKRFGLYIRKRYGVVKNNGIENENAQSVIEKKEKDNCPALDSQVLLESDSILEIFFADIGMGLKGSLHEHFSKAKKVYKYPIRELFCEVLRDGTRKDSSLSLTAFGGLHFLCRILRESNGYVWCNEGVEWVGASCANLLKSNAEVNAALTGTYNNNLHSGLAWGIRIPFSDSAKRKSNLAVNWMGQPNDHPVFRAYQTQAKKIIATRTLVFDDRQEVTTLMQGAAEEWKSISEEDWCNWDINKVDTFVWFPKAFYSKNKIIRVIKAYIKKISENSSEKEINLIIGDIPPHELISFYYAFKGSNSAKLGTEKIKGKRQN